MYRTGDAQSAERDTYICDSRDDNYESVDLQNAVYLPHSCDQWIIGGKSNIRTMIEDLTELLNDPQIPDSFPDKGE